MRLLFIVLFLVSFGVINTIRATTIYICEVENWSQQFKKMGDIRSHYFTISKQPYRGSLEINEQWDAFNDILKKNSDHRNEDSNEVFMSFSKKFIEVYYSVEEKFKNPSGIEFLFTYGYRTDKCPLKGHNFKEDFPKCQFKFKRFEDEIADGVCVFSHFLKCDETPKKGCPKS